VSSQKVAHRIQSMGNILADKVRVCKIQVEKIFLNEEWGIFI
jgi:hypothetical protein